MKAKHTHLIIACIIATVQFAQAQKETNIWHFGYGAALDFNSGSPVELAQSSMSTDEGCATISDANGNLLFYTNGVDVYGRNHLIMPNGNNLTGGWSSTQSAVAVPFPGSATQYYIFTTNQSGTGPFSYSIVDMTLNGGFGDVTTKNTLLRVKSSEKLTAVKHANNTDFWVMGHSYPTDTLFAYLVTASGVSATPVETKIGMTLGGNDFRGYLRFSSDGSKLAHAVFASNYVDLFDFDNTTGIVTNLQHLTLPAPVSSQGAQGLEFSSSGQFLYCAHQQPGKIYQWDISSGNAATINATLQLIGTSTNTYLGAMQMASNGKIYVSEYNSSFLGIINYPDSAGISCNYIDNGFTFSNATCRLGLPNFTTSFLPTSVNTASGIQNEISVYPVPADAVVMVSVKKYIAHPKNIQLFSADGKIVYQKMNNAFSENITSIDVSNLAYGVYFLQLEIENKLVTKKILVAHNR